MKTKKGGSLNVVPNLRLRDGLIPDSDEYIDARKIRGYNSGILRVDPSGIDYIFATRLYSPRKNKYCTDRPVYYNLDRTKVFNAVHLTIIRIDEQNNVSFDPNRGEAVYLLGIPGDYCGEDPRMVWEDFSSKVFMVVVPTRLPPTTLLEDSYRPYGALFQLRRSSNVDRYSFRCLGFRRLEVGPAEVIRQHEKNWIPFTMGDHSYLIPNLQRKVVWKHRSGKEDWSRYTESVKFEGGDILCSLIDSVRGGTPGVSFEFQGSRGSLMVVHATLDKRNSNNSFRWSDNFSVIRLIDGYHTTNQSPIQSEWSKKYVMAFVYIHGHKITHCTAFFMPVTRRGEHSRVIFPCGLARAPSGDYLVTFGENDEVSGYEFFKASKIREKLKPLAYWQRHREEVLCNHYMGDWCGYTHGELQEKVAGQRYYTRGDHIVDITSYTYRRDGECERTVDLQLIDESSFISSRDVPSSCCLS